MNPEDIQTLSDLLSLNLGNLILSWIIIVISLILKDLLSTLVQGALFYFDPQFKVGDQVYVNNEKMIIQSISVRWTVFKSLETSRWNYVANNRINYLNIEKSLEEKHE